MTAKRWIVRRQDTTRAAALARVLGTSPIVAALLISRGYGDQRCARAFLKPSSDQLHEPYPMLGMKKAVSRLLRTIDQNGFSSTVITTWTGRLVRQCCFVRCACWELVLEAGTATDYRPGDLQSHVSSGKGVKLVGAIWSG